MSRQWWAAAAAVLLAGAVACTSSTGGVGSGSASGVPSSSTSPPGFPSTTPSSTSSDVTSSSGVTVTSSATAGETESASTSSGTPITVVGTASGTRYDATLYAQSRVSNCAKHSYGQKMIAFFTAHECGGAVRRLFTVDVNGRSVILSTVVVTAAPGPSAGDVYEYAAQFQRLEKSNCDCGVNDLLREGYQIPGGPSKIPANEAFQVLGQDNAVAVFDAWYATGATENQEPALLRLEQDLFLTSVAAP